MKKAEFQAKENKAVETEQLPSEIQQAIDKELLPANLIKVPKTLSNPHSIVANWITEERRQQESYSRFDSHFNWPKPNKLEPKRRRIVSALLKALEERGFKIETDYYRRELWVIQGLDKLQFSVDEHIQQYRRELTEAEKADHWNKDSKWKQVSEPTGFLKLRLFINAWKDKVEFLENPVEPLEGQLNKVVAKIIEHFWYIKKARLHSEERQHQYWLQEQERERQRKAAEAELQKKKQLLKDSLNWKKAKRIRQYVKAVESKALPDSEEFMKWKEWALAYADELDTFISDEVLE